MSLLLIPIGIAINFALGALAKTLNLPIFLDSVGTILAAVLGGPIVGAITGFLGVLSISAFAPSAVVWSFQAAFIGLVAGLLARFGWFRGWGKTIVSTLIIILLSVALSATISYVVYKGFDGYGIGVIRAALEKAGWSKPLAILTTSAVAELIDKSISVALPMIVVGLMSDRFLNKFPNGPHLRHLETAPAVERAPRTTTTTTGPGGATSAPASRADGTTGGYGSYDEPVDGSKDA